MIYMVRHILVHSAPIPICRDIKTGFISRPGKHTISNNQMTSSRKLPEQKSMRRKISGSLGERGSTCGHHPKLGL